MAETFQAIGASLPLDCIVLDTSIGGPDVLDLLTEFRRTSPQQPAILIGRSDELRLAVAAVKLGACDFVPKPIDWPQFLDALDAVFDFSPSCAPAIDPVAQAKVDSLTPRQRQVLIGMANGKLNKTIAHDLELSVRTVETYRAIVMDKIGGSIADAVRTAAAGGLLPPCATCVTLRALGPMPAALPKAA